VHTLFEERHPLYLQYADCVVDCADKTLEEIEDAVATLAEG